VKADNFDALNLFGIIAAQTGRPQEAFVLFYSCCWLKPHTTSEISGENMRKLFLSIPVSLVLLGSATAGDTTVGERFKAALERGDCATAESLVRPVAQSGAVS